VTKGEVGEGGGGEGGGQGQLLGCVVTYWSILCSAKLENSKGGDDASHTDEQVGNLWIADD
jgi:hypothetical protein